VSPPLVPVADDDDRDELDVIGVEQVKASAMGEGQLSKQLNKRVHICTHL